MLPGIKNISCLPCDSLPQYIEPRAMAGKRFFFTDFDALAPVSLTVYGQAELERKLHTSPQTRTDEVTLVFYSDDALLSLLKTKPYAFIVEYADGGRFLLGNDERFPAVDITFEVGDEDTPGGYKYEITFSGMFSLVYLE